MVREPEIFPALEGFDLEEHFRIYAISNVALGRDEKVYMSRSTIDSINPLDPFFTRTEDSTAIDLVIDAPVIQSPVPSSSSLADFLEDTLGESSNLSNLDVIDSIDLEVDTEALKTEPSYLSSLLASLQSLISAPPTSTTRSPSPSSSPNQDETIKRQLISAALPIGPGAALLPSIPDPDLTYSTSNPLSWTAIYIHPNNLCSERLAPEIPRNNQVIVIPRGGCSFSTKLQNIPPFPPKPSSLQLVIVVSYPEHEVPHYDFSSTAGEDTENAISNADGQPDPEAHAPIPPPPPRQSASSRRSTQGSGHVQESYLVQPMLDQTQYTPAGLPRQNPIPLIMVGGGDRTMQLFRQAEGVGVRRRYHFLTQGVRIGNLIVL
jgi:hypothetical protein